MSLLKRIRCNLGHTHEIFSVLEVIEPMQCFLQTTKPNGIQLGTAWIDEAEEISQEVWDRNNETFKSQEDINKRLQRSKEVIESNINQKEHPILQRRKGKQMDTTQDLHQDSRPTVVLINKKLFDLTPSTLSWQYVQDLAPSERPHVRFLNPIPVRTKEQQKLKNQGEQEMHLRCKDVPKSRTTPLSEAKNNMRDGANPEIEIKKLQGLKAKAVKDGDEVEARRIRKALRKLGAKRYSQKSPTKE